ncbi:hypothetical protein BDR03DRAFT_941014 [Suillus americanus]|nr:hypothetical protein BDR03DRAFT_941014 [Suillus americanus]
MSSVRDDRLTATFISIDHHNIWPIFHLFVLLLLFTWTTLTILFKWNKSELAASKSDILP